MSIYGALLIVTLLAVAIALAVTWPRRLMGAAEHLAWAKARALAYVEAAERIQELPGGEEGRTQFLLVAVASMASDLGSHDDLAGYINPFLSLMGAKAAQAGDAQAVRDWIEGFTA
jgi:hypothetical protein